MCIVNVHVDLVGPFSPSEKGYTVIHESPHPEWQVNQLAGSFFPECSTRGGGSRLFHLHMGGSVVIHTEAVLDSLPPHGWLSCNTVHTR